jgi:rubrerythrin
VEEQKALEALRSDESSRGAFLKMVGGAGAAGALGIFLAACGDDDEEDKAAETSQDTAAKKDASKGDAAIVNYALTLEYLEADFYRQVIASGEIRDRRIVEAAKTIAENEQDHVEALRATAEMLGGEVAKKPTTKFDDVLAGGPDKILETAATVENLGAAAYLGEAGNITDKEILAAALSIHTVEGRHAALLNRLVGKSIVPDGAFAKPASMDEVLKAVKPFIAS